MPKGAFYGGLLAGQTRFYSADALTICGNSSRQAVLLFHVGNPTGLSYKSFGLADVADDFPIRGH